MPNTRSLGYRMRESEALKDDPLIACPNAEDTSRANPVPHLPSVVHTPLPDVNLESINVLQRTELSHVEQLEKLFLIT
jgi:hypothetical protein